jgi:hypothetical protein
VQISYYEWVKSEKNSDHFERKFIGNYLVEVAELSSAGYARVKFKNEDLQIKNHDKFFPVGTEVTSHAGVANLNITKTETLGKVARLLGKTPKTEVLASYSVNDEVLVNIGVNKYKAKISSLTAKGQIQISFEDAIMQRVFSERLFNISEIQIAKISNSSCGTTLGEIAKK